MISLLICGEVLSEAGSFDPTFMTNKIYGLI